MGRRDLTGRAKERVHGRHATDSLSASHTRGAQGENDIRAAFSTVRCSWPSKRNIHLPEIHMQEPASPSPAPRCPEVPRSIFGR